MQSLVKTERFKPCEGNIEYLEEEKKILAVQIWTFKKTKVFFPLNYAKTLNILPQIYLFCFVFFINNYF